MTSEAERGLDSTIPLPDEVAISIARRRVVSKSPTEPPTLPFVPRRFRLLEKLGQGGMGIVHRALDCELGREVALKYSNGSKSEDVYRLKREFRLLCDIRHPNLVRPFELFAEDTTAFFTMELVSGSSFYSFVHGGAKAGAPLCDYRRLREAAWQLASAISSVHAADNLHRDLKPSNIIVTSSGRLVLFDFGLAESLSSRNAKTKRAGVMLGTRGYLSPEQACGEPLTRAADWFSFGVTLFEAATGRMPFEIPFDRRHLRDAPPDLAELIAGLLHPVPQRRPAGADVLDVLGAGRKPARVEVPRFSPAERAEEARAFSRALDTVKRGQSAILHLHGDPGAGKSELARHFMVEAQNAGALVLRGRCRPEENVAFNALDEVVDELSHTLEHLPYAQLLSVVPPHVAALPRLFPVIGRLDRTLDGSFVRSREDDVCTLRRARGALKDLLMRLGHRKTLVVWIDDVERGDRESGELLSELLRPPDTPPMLLLLSHRTDGPKSPMLETLYQRGFGLESFEIRLGFDEPPVSSSCA